MAVTEFYITHGRFPHATPEGCAKICPCLMFLLAFKIFIILLALTDPVNRKLPTFSIEKFYIPALDISSNSTSMKENQTIYFDLKLGNHEKMNGLLYDPFNLTFSYAAILQNESVSAIANFTVPGFYQGYGKTAHRRGWPETHPMVDRKIFGGGGGGTNKVRDSFGILRIESATAVKFKSMLGKSKRHRLMLGARVEINEAGQMVSKKGIELTEISAASLTATTFGGYYVLVMAFSSAFTLAVI